MKIEQPAIKPPFRPVILTLESQEEVNAICTLVQSTRIIEALPVLSNWYKQFRGYGDYSADWTKLMNIIVN